MQGLPTMIRPQGPVIVLQQGTDRTHGRQAQLANINAGKSVSDIVRTTLGPNSMMKMLLDPMGGIVITNDGNAILREIDVKHPAAKSVIELSRAQDEEIGDGTTSVVILAGEIMALSEDFLYKQIHPSVIVNGYFAALKDALKILEGCAIRLDLKDENKLLEVIKASTSTKFSTLWSEIVPRLALEAAKIVRTELPNGKAEIDVKRYARIEKIPGGSHEDCQVIKGCLLNKDVTHPAMRRMIEKPRVVLLDCPLEYKKGESQTNVEVTKEEDWEKLLKQEEEEVKQMCDDIIKVGCDLVITEKGVSDLAQHYLSKGGVTAIRRVKKTDNNRLARVSGATIVNRTEEISVNDVGTKCDLFKIEKIGDEYYTFLTAENDPRACTVLLRGASKDVLNEVERNYLDAVNVARNILIDGALLPGGGAIEMELSARLNESANKLPGTEQWSYRAVASAFEVIPRTLAQNCGCQVIRVLTELRAKHNQPDTSLGVNFGINGMTGNVVDVTKIGIWDTMAVKAQLIKTAIECAAMIMRVDDVISGIGKKAAPQLNLGNNQPEQDPETFGDARDG